MATETPSIPLDVDHLDRPNESTKFDYLSYGDKVNYTRHCIYVDGKPRVLISGEFHYWRVPDVTRWRPILMQLKAAGMNCLRFYFNWGYHSPSQSRYVFEGNRNIDYLLTLCEQLELFVIAAPGPYICAETQCGGFPSWLVSQREVRVRHLKYHFYKVYDERFAQFSEQWYRQILPIIVKHERISKPDGCVISLQIENELKQLFGLDPEIRGLAEVARSCGVKSPIFHNDDSPEGAWSAGNYKRNPKTLWLTRTSEQRYRADLYGVDLYFMFPNMKDSASDQSAFIVIAFQFGGFAAFLQAFGVGGLGLGGRDLPLLRKLGCFVDPSHGPPDPESWDHRHFRKIDRFETIFQGFGGSAANGPVILAETQVGWINQWGKRRDYDDLYSFFGGEFSATLLSSLFAQGISIVSFYMAYGGTNYGTAGDAEVYTSYDYTAFVREYGKLSERGRRLRQTSYFLQSFQDVGTAESRLISKDEAVRDEQIMTSLPSMLVNVRKAVVRFGSVEDKDVPRFLFLRNLEHHLESKEPTFFSLAVQGIVVPCMIYPRQAYIAVANYKVSQTTTIHVCSIPIMLRCTYSQVPLWVLRIPASGSLGRVVFRVSKKQTMKWSARWAVLSHPNSSQENNMDLSGVSMVSSQDDSASSPILNAPLEEMPLSTFEPPSDPKSAIQIQVSKLEESEDYQFVSLAFWKPCVVSLFDETDSNAETKPFMHFLAVSEADADSLFCNFGSDTLFSRDSAKRPCILAYGADEITFSPDENKLHFEFNGKESSAIVFVDDSASQSILQSQGQTVEPLPHSVLSLLPGGYKVKPPVPPSSLISHIPTQVSLDNARKCKVDWAKDITWKYIDIENERDPLDHLYTHGHVAYRCQFDLPSDRRNWHWKKILLTINIRHVATVWVNGNNVGGQLTFSHNAISAGAMHFFDFSWSGKKAYDVSQFMDFGSSATVERDGVAVCPQEIIIFIHSFGQNRQAFLLNDVRNRRGLLSVSLSGSGIANTRWSIYGVSTEQVSNPFNIGGVPCEEKYRELSFDDATWSPVPDLVGGKTKLDIKISEGLQWIRAYFETPTFDSLYRLLEGVGSGNMEVRFPLRLRLLGGKTVTVFVYVNGVMIGRYLSDVGPQSDFYIMEDLLNTTRTKHRAASPLLDRKDFVASKDSNKNVLALAIYSWEDTSIDVQVLPWVVDPISGNLNALKQQFEPDSKPEVEMEPFCLVGTQLSLGPAA